MNKLVVTDEMLEVALETFRAEKHSAINHNDPRCMKAAIQAVFDMVNQHTDINVGDTKMEQEKPLDDGWIEWQRLSGPDLPIETKIEVKLYDGTIVESSVGYAERNFSWSNIISYRIIEPVSANNAPTPKQTLLEYVNTKVAWCKNKEEALNYQLLKLISEYLEERLK